METPEAQRKVLNKIWDEQDEILLFFKPDKQLLQLADFDIAGNHIYQQSRNVGEYLLIYGVYQSYTWMDSFIYFLGEKRLCLNPTYQKIENEVLIKAIQESNQLLEEYELSHEPGTKEVY